MLRAISEIAVAMSVSSLPEKPILWASSRPFRRASTMSPSCAITTCVASAATGCVVVSAPLQPRAAFLEVERGRNAVEREAELHDRECDFRLDAHDPGIGAAQPRGLRDAPQRAGCERVHHVERADVDHDAAGAE